MESSCAGHSLRSLSPQLTASSLARVREILSFELPKVMMSSPCKKLSLKEAKRKTSFTLKPDSLLVGLKEAGAGKLMGRVTSQTHVT